MMYETVKYLICSGSKYFVTGKWFQRRLEYLITASKLKHKRLNAECSTRILIVLIKRTNYDPDSEKLNFIFSFVHCD